MLLRNNYDYSYGHPWFHYLGNEALPCKDIPIRHDYTTFDKLPKDPKKAQAKKEAMIKAAKEHLVMEENRYNQLQLKGLNALSSYEAKGGIMNWCTAISLVTNHISYTKSQLHYLGVRQTVTKSLSLLDILILL